MQKLTCTLFLMTFCCLTLFSSNSINTVTLEILEQENVECFGEDSGYLELEASNGTAPYSFTLNGETNNSGVFEALLGGNYTAVVTDQTGCSASIPVNISEPNELVLSINEVNNTGCSGATNGSFEVEASGGIGNYTYILNGNVNTTGIFENLASGMYTVGVEDDNGCEADIMVTVDDGTGINVVIIDQVDIDCFGNSNGMVQVEGQGGEAPYEYRIGANINNTGIFSGLSQGAHLILIVDNVGCSTTQNITINEPSELVVSAMVTSNTSCFGENDGSFQVTATGGTQGYIYETSNESNDDGIFSSQGAGIYDITVTDANGCMDFTTVTVTEPAEIIISNPMINGCRLFWKFNWIYRDSSYWWYR